MLQNTVNDSADASHSVDEEPPEEAAVDEELESVSEEDQSDSGGARICGEKRRRFSDGKWTCS